MAIRSCLVRPRSRGRVISSRTTAAIVKRSPLTAGGPNLSNNPCAVVAESWMPAEARTTRPAAQAALGRSACGQSSELTRRCRPVAR
jgi:hypothetical protein